ncbi:hypothetical protein IJI17_01315 [Candidatus Saccharibacteria bacterium]|nr:hypothetical protein [Candidatus Saccharibacteria bacterium]
MKSNLALLAVSLCLATFAAPAFAEETPSTKTPSESQLINISENCSSIRQSLKLLQRSDARARTYFGAIYETASSKYITPLNLRLVKNNLSSVALINLQTSLSTTRANFNADYIDYAKSLEELIALDCRLEPAQFYAKLESTREKRQILAEDAKTMNAMLANSVKSVELIKENLGD